MKIRYIRKISYFVLYSWSRETESLIFTHVMDMADQVNIQEQIKEPNQIFINPPSLTDLDEETAAEEKIWVRRKKVFYWKIIKNFLWFIMHIKVFLNTPRKQVFFCNYLKKYFCLSKMLLNFQDKKCFKSIITWVKIFCIKSFYSSS